MTIDQKLLDILICPNCRGDIEYVESESVIRCTGECRYSYPVRDGIPVMLIDEAAPPTESSDA